ncbi:MAG: 3-oxo-5-alpha-steroid 4-dehydrogenase [Prevotella sp.]|nr:3-oxo-5-alpha-steroid 4-dehydrogenase [Bacteroides sp.]MCM1365732.1 3-oxo-5-alpha-steroid 4-dehydrogenase [Prevotella sp.]MCM1436402.1 3-oxo-5-alpha-steroid 4-dehydrogenase [Prevotella sp.]
MILHNYTFFNSVIAAMTILAVIVFFALQRHNAPYGINYSPSWGPSIPNRPGWIIMETPAFLCLALLWVLSPRALNPAPAVMASLYLIHYFQRSFIFPLLINGKNKMPWMIILSGALFNVINAYLIGDWIFFLAPENLYQPDWLTSPLFISGTIIFLGGMYINLRSDYIIRHLRKPGDSRHYIPYGGMFRYVSCANYLGEFTEWVGFAILSWSLPGAVFALWTFANLAPRAKSVHRKYITEFGPQYSKLNRKAIIPFLY